MTPILEIKNISKKFRIGHEQEPYLSLRDSITGFLSSPFKGGREGAEDFWALKDVSFDVMPGESIGIIGKNGAGKSTLLKILSKITPPTEGKIIARGRVASLLEVGTGFHPELTGRENIFLNGSILGMKRKEIQKKFDEIIDFSGIERFLDTALKHYSSGMQLRLAFAVAAFLEPEILVIDEVLAVGDAEFQKKCMGKMDEVSKSGRTIIFVSHDLSAVNRLCSSAIYLQHGRVKCSGYTKEVISKYIGDTRHNNSLAVVNLENINIRNGQQNFSKLSSIALKDENGASTKSFKIGEAMNVELNFKTFEKIDNLEIGFAIANQIGTPLIGCVNIWDGHLQSYASGMNTVMCTLPAIWLLPNSYRITVWLKRQTEKVDDEIEDAISFDIIDFTDSKPAAYYSQYNHLNTFQKCNWKTIIQSDAK